MLTEALWSFKGTPRAHDADHVQDVQHARHARIDPDCAPRDARVRRSLRTTSMDWARKDVVTTGKNQGQRGSWWAFSTTGEMEDAWTLDTGNLVSLSKHLLVDYDYTCSVCIGGLICHAFAFAERYTETDGICTSSRCTVGITKVNWSFSRTCPKTTSKQ